MHGLMMSDPLTVRCELIMTGVTQVPCTSLIFYTDIWDLPIWSGATFVACATIACAKIAQFPLLSNKMVQTHRPCVGCALPSGRNVRYEVSLRIATIRKTTDYRRRSQRTKVALAADRDPVVDGRSNKQLVPPEASRPLSGQGDQTRALFYFFLGGLLDLLGLRDGVFPGVALLSRRR